MFASIFVFAVLPLFFSVGAENITYSPHDHEAHNCLLPPHPEHGRYRVRDYPKAAPGERYSSVKLDISCDSGYRNNNTIKSVSCINGDWSATIPTCVMDRLGYCTLSAEDPKVAYYCLSFVGTYKRSRECASVVPSGEMVIPFCKFPYYFSRSVLPEMHCRGGTWDYEPICEPACGLTTQHRQLEGKSGSHLELPWHASIFKTSQGYNHTCGGTLITETKIISAARCFYTGSYDKALQPASGFQVAVNKMYLEYNDTYHRNRQLSDVTDIKIPSNYKDDVPHYEHNIAVVIVKTPFFFHLSVRPVCLDFDKNLDRTQLTEGNSGKTAYWSKYWTHNDQLYDALNVVDFPYVKDEHCENNLMYIYGGYSLTKDKFCMRIGNGRMPDKTDYGTGLVFFDPTSQRYYLRGVASDYALDRNYVFMMLYTSIMKHEDFIKQQL